MANSISDVTVNISVEDVINPAAFGIPLLLAFSDTAAKVDLDYTECYSIADVEAAVGDSLHKVNNSYKITAAEGESITGTTLSDTLHGITFKSTENFVVESNSKKYGETSFTKRVKSIEKGDLTVVPTSSDFISVYGICSSKDSTVDVVLFDADNNVEFARKSIGGEDISKVTFEVGTITQQIFIFMVKVPKVKHSIFTELTMRAQVRMEKH